MQVAEAEKAQQAGAWLSGYHWGGTRGEILPAGWAAERKPTCHRKTLKRDAFRWSSRGGWR